jgi:hypothetical protein
MKKKTTKINLDNNLDKMSISNFGDAPLDIPGDPYHEDEGFPPLPEEKLKVTKRKYVKKIK